MEKQNNSELYREWLAKIRSSEKNYEDYYALVEEIRKYYRNERKRNKQSIFWSSVETLKPFLYFKQPQAAGRACIIVHAADAAGILSFFRSCRKILQH